MSTTTNMAYARRLYRRSSYGTRRRPYPRRKMAVKPPPAKKTMRRYVRRNAYAVNTLMRDVRYLKQAQYGQVQKGLHILNRPLTPTQGQPVFCCINDLSAQNTVLGTDGAAWYQLDATGTINNIASRFEPNNLGYYEKMNTDILNGGVAFINDLKLTFRIFCSPDSGQQISNKRVRIDFFKQKARALVTPTSLSAIQQLPSVAAQQRLRNMATPTLNKFASEYFHRIGTKWVFLNPSKVNSTDKGTGAALKYVSMTVPKKYLGRITQQFTSPVTINDAAAGTPGPLWSPENFPNAQRIWCSISSDDPNTFPGNDPEIQVTVQRYCAYRDAIGSSAL